MPAVTHWIDLSSLQAGKHCHISHKNKKQNTRLGAMRPGFQHSSSQMCPQGYHVPGLTGHWWNLRNTWIIPNIWILQNFNYLASPFYYTHHPSDQVLLTPCLLIHSEVLCCWYWEPSQPGMLHLAIPYLPDLQRRIRTSQLSPSSLAQGPVVRLTPEGTQGPVTPVSLLLLVPVA